MGKTPPVTTRRPQTQDGDRPELRTLAVLGLILSCLAGPVGVAVSATAFFRSRHRKQPNPVAVAGIIVGLAATSVFIAGVFYFHAVVNGDTGVCAEQGPGTHDGPTGTFTCPTN
ncbi:MULTISPECIES: hypothetical protein [unclassified Frondihabitans]|uniref:hypothetical protein n=1 Tax=unclassified Frondihabitans TaxID=2626248 RepID=UPI000F4F5E84|nr:MULTISPECIES: hypothetical protein [unclassified Frondihabitans]RPE73722.1 hypothetical protein EDF37_3419 [Frondihabitans sp. PhB153]RPF02141.1 hypothetical protein EDF39_3462 [Frondihabitans sp. PhB161]